MVNLRFKGLILALMVILTPIMGFAGEIDTEARLSDENFTSETSRNPSGIVDVPNWRIGDTWNYNGYLDVRDFIASSGVSTNVQTLTGSLVSEVVEIYTQNIGGVSTIVYKVESNGDFDAQNVNLDGQNGDLTVEMDTIEIYRASDLGTISQEATVEIDFCADFLWWCVNVDVAELVVSNEYDPPTEGYDFPLSVGESWNSQYTAYTNFSGTTSVDGLTIPDDIVGSNYTEWDVVSRGFSGVTYSGCEQSYNITTSNSNGEETGYKWYCPAIKNNIKSSATQSLGFSLVSSLTSYTPASASTSLNVDLEYQLSPLDMQLDATVTVTNSVGSPVANQDVEFRYEIEEDYRAFTTDANGQFTVDFNSGNSQDGSNGGTEHGSHGVIAWIDGASPLVGTSTLITDQNTHPVDLIADAAGVTVERTRNNRTVTLNPAIGFNAVPNDLLTFSVPVINRGILTSPSTNLKVTGPDGFTETTYVPSLYSLQEQRVELNWVVPAGQQIGNAGLVFVVDEAEEITNDGNRSNNMGTFSLYIGRLPIANLSINSPIQTFETASLNGLNSVDPDGGILDCVFEIESTTGNMQLIEDDDCIHEVTWDDDGEYLVRLTITDGESDTDTIEKTVDVLNRPPEIIVEASEYSIPVLSSVTFEVTHREDVDTNNPIAPVDISWQAACEEGSTVSSRCTVSPASEGDYTIQVIAMDDDGETVTEEVTVEVTNIAPSNLGAEVWLSGTRLTPDSRGVYTINEGDEIEIRGWAEDSPNDISNLIHLWKPDAENHPEIQSESIGQYSSIQHVYTTSEMHLATLSVTDDDGVSSEPLIIAIDVINIAPSIDPISNPLPVAEDDEISITASVWDTIGDAENLVNCFDTEPDVDTNENGNTDDDCNIEGTKFVGSWPDAQNVPSSIIFHTMDDDGETASVEIPIIVNNIKPDAHAMVNNQNPTIGDSVVLSANLTIDSIFDMENMIYVWDLDVTKDSDGNGNPSDDEDYVGKWFVWKTDTSGTISIKLTASDESLSDSMVITMNIEEAPFSFAEAITSPIGLVLIILILAGGGGFFYVKSRNPNDLIEAPPYAKGRRKVSMDDAFDNPEFDPFNKKTGNKQNKERKETKFEETKDLSKTEEVFDEMNQNAIQSDELDKQYEETRSTERVDEEVLSELLEDSESSKEEE